MYIGFPTNIIAVSVPYTEHHETLSSEATVGYGKAQNTTVSSYSSVEFRPTVWTPLPSTGNRYHFSEVTPEIKHWPPLQPSENPNSTDKSYNPVHVIILSGVLIVVLVWVVVIGVVLKNKIQARRQRRRERELPSYLDLHHNCTTAQPSSDLSNMETSSRPSEQTDTSVIDIETPVENSPSFTLYQPSAPDLTIQNSVNEQPPSYAEIQEQNQNVISAQWDLPPSYQEAEQQNTKK